METRRDVPRPRHGPNLFLGHSPLSHAAAMLATQAKVYTVPWEPGMSRAVANCWSPGDCSACYAKRKDNVPCCAPRNARVVDTLRNLNTWSLVGVTDQSYDRDPTGKGTWAPLPPEYEGEADWVKAWRKEGALRDEVGATEAQLPRRRSRLRPRGADTKRARHQGDAGADAAGLGREAPHSGGAALGGARGAGDRITCCDTYS